MVLAQCTSKNICDLCILILLSHAHEVFVVVVNVRASFVSCSPEPAHDASPGTHENGNINQDAVCISWSIKPEATKNHS